MIFSARTTCPPEVDKAFPKTAEGGSQNQKNTFPFISPPIQN
jgi:hypothetical protein